MNPGIAQGFIRLGSLAHRILTHMHKHGPVVAGDLRRTDAHIEAVQVSATLTRLRRHGFIHVAGRHRRPGYRAQRVFSLDADDQFSSPVVDGNERSRQYRARKKVKVSSVFDFRGQIQL